MNILKKTTLALAVAGAMAAPAYAINGVQFDFSGSGGAGVGVDEMTGNRAHVLGKNTVTGGATSTSFLIDGTTLYGQGQINAAAQGGGGIANAALTSGFFTYQFAIPLNAAFPNGNTAGSTLTWDQGALPNYSSLNYFKMFYTNPAVVNEGVGTGYGDAGTGTLILEGKVTINTSGASVSINSTVTKALSATNAPAGVNNTTPSFGIAGSINFDIDVCDSTEIVGGTSPTTACGAQVSESFWSTNFFRSMIDQIEMDVIFSDNITSNFSTRPAPGSVVGQAANFGNGVNDYVCGLGGVGVNGTCDLLFSGTPATITFNGQFAPEPGSLALLGLGLAGLGLSGRRRRSKAQS